jgi:hypothetical protein
MSRPVEAPDKSVAIENARSGNSKLTHGAAVKMLPKGAKSGKICDRHGAAVLSTVANLPRLRRQFEPLLKIVWSLPAK